MVFLYAIPATVREKSNKASVCVCVCSILYYQTKVIKQVGTNDVTVR